MITTKTSIQDWGFKLRNFDLNSLLENQPEPQNTEEKNIAQKKKYNQQNLVVPTHNKYGKTKLFIHATNPAILTGLRIKISGRLITQRVKPKKTINLYEVGGFKKTKNNIVDYALYTSKNKRGAYTVKVWLASTIHSMI